MGRNSSQTGFPNYPIPTDNGPVILSPRHTGRVWVCSDPTAPVTVDRVQVVSFHENFDLQDGMWAPVNPTRRAAKRYRAGSAKPTPVSQTTYRKLLELLRPIVTDWAAEHYEILDQAEGRWLTAQLDAERHWLAMLDKDRQNVLAKIQELKARQHRRRKRSRRPVASGF